MLERQKQHNRRTYEQVYAEQTTNLRFQKRPRLSLFSDLYTIVGLPIRHLILDEAQYIKNWETGIHRAIKALVYTRFLAVTGTPITNRWWDIYGIMGVPGLGDSSDKIDIEDNDEDDSDEEGGSVGSDNEEMGDTDQGEMSDDDSDMGDEQAEVSMRWRCVLWSYIDV